MSQLAMTYSGCGMSRDRKMSRCPMVLFLLPSLGAGLVEALEVNFLMRDSMAGSPSRVSTATAAKSSLGTKLE